MIVTNRTCNGGGRAFFCEEGGDEIQRKAEKIILKLDIIGRRKRQRSEGPFLIHYCLSSRTHQRHDEVEQDGVEEVQPHDSVVFRVSVRHDSPEDDPS